MLKCSAKYASQFIFHFMTTYRNEDTKFVAITTNPLSSAGSLEILCYIVQPIDEFALWLYNIAIFRISNFLFIFRFYKEEKD